VYLLHDVGTKFLHRKGTNVADEAADEGIGETVVGQIQDILDDIVPIGILNKGQCIVGDLTD
jgi:hypothetical protein